MVEALKTTHAWWESTLLKAYHPYRNTGTLRTLTFREGKRTQDKMAILTVSGHPDYAIPKKDLDAWVKSLTEQFPGMSCFLRVHQTCKGVPTQFYELHLAGPDHIEEIMKIDLGDQKISLRLNISPQSFFQPNTFQAERLYSEALGLLNLSNAEHVIDLYAGTATIGMALSYKARKVTSIELNPYAMMDAQANLEANQINNLELIKGDAAEVLAKLNETPSALVVDPPRSGLGPKALEPILRLAPSKILYISCNPRTQAADIEILTQKGYQLLALQPVDQFPHTPHIENIALLSRGEWYKS
jgi:23S rRNA (uracil-5-)-methyltransferase RumA